jgi:hypothetical protein
MQQTSVGLLQCIYLEEVGNDNGEVGYYQHIHIVNTPICLRLNLKEVEFECGRLNYTQKMSEIQPVMPLVMATRGTKLEFLEVDQAWKGKTWR